MISDPERNRISALAERLGTHIPPGIGLQAWSLPILEALLKRIEKLEKELHDLRTS